MKKIFFTLVITSSITGLESQEIRIENNGNLILEDIPLIPESIKEDLSKFTHNNNEARKLTILEYNATVLIFLLPIASSLFINKIVSDPSKGISIIVDNIGQSISTSSYDYVECYNKCQANNHRKGIVIY